MTYSSMDSNYSYNLVEHVQDVLQVNSTRPFVLPLWQKVIWSFVFGIMVTVAVIGNTIIMWIIIAHRRMRTVTNYFLLNLSIADFMMATFNVIFNFVFMLESHWPFGLTYCIFTGFVANVTISTSIFTMMVMSIDRYMAIVRPLTPRMSRKTVCLIIITIWCMSTILALPTLLYSTVVSFKYNFGERTLCLMLWPDGHMATSKKEYWYNVVFLLVTYVIPMILMAITYSRMGSVLWGSARIGETTDRQETLIRSKQKVVKMLATVIMLFGICWLPYHVYFLYIYHDKDVAYADYIQHIYLGIYWLAMSNSMYNPIVYYWMNVRFRAYFEVVLCWCWNKRHHDRRHSRPLNLQESRTLSTRTRSFRLTLSKTLGIKRSFKDRHIPNNIDCHHC
ncbi:tachykinin-like peptides receptor 86C [Centruroides vittatus]|uniref:tachykinin-like peptides receptor 86C n=1 Tax=Centruroides vittatus TaxID=120091 RepID=UPI00350EF8DA